MKRNRKAQCNLNRAEQNQLKKVNKLHFDKIPEAILVRILLTEAMRKYTK
jgi:hypothetical protein